ncbi:MAG: hypothetical protein JW941_03450 [Candidatus Coatesbacteria bacterium]|nr:hypothetical protein [Candidatus Coatesbacteria bacterium]
MAVAARKRARAIKNLDSPEAFKASPEFELEAQLRLRCFLPYGKPHIHPCDSDDGISSAEPPCNAAALGVGKLIRVISPGGFCMPYALTYEIISTRLIGDVYATKIETS